MASGYYPAGAEFDPCAPYNEPLPRPIKFHADLGFNLMINTEFESENYDEDERYMDESEIFNDMVVSPQDMIYYAKSWCELKAKEAHEKKHPYDERIWNEALKECDKYEVEYNDGIIE